MLHIQYLISVLFQCSRNACQQHAEIQLCALGTTERDSESQIVIFGPGKFYLLIKWYKGLILPQTASFRTHHMPGWSDCGQDCNEEENSENRPSQLEAFCGDW